MHLKACWNHNEKKALQTFKNRVKNPKQNSKLKPVEEVMYQICIHYVNEMNVLDSCT